MMKWSRPLLTLTMMLLVAAVSAEPACEDNIALDNNLSDMTETCTAEIVKQIKKEIDASMTYLSMAAFYSRDNINRPGFAKLFFDAASEEREHGILLIEYLLNRGYDFKDFQFLQPTSKIDVVEFPNGVKSLETALSKEKEVTASIKDVIKKCEKTNSKLHDDYHLVDYLSGDFLDEQYKGQRDLAGKLNTLKKMIFKHQHLGEFLFDKKLLDGGLF